MLDRTETTQGASNGSIAERAEEQTQKLLDYSQELLGKVEMFVRERPAVALLSAVGLGFLVGRLIRR
jgi:ElaB/YqjD/DUF883 family membrane-anchored ribosome-binding protein